VLYNVAATVTSFPGGSLSDRLGPRGPLLATAAGLAAFLVAYLLFAVSSPVVAPLGAALILAGVRDRCAETAEHAAVAAFAPVDVRGQRSDCWRPCKQSATWPPARRRAALHGGVADGRVRLPRGVDGGRAGLPGLGGRAPGGKYAARSDATGRGHCAAGPSTTSAR
jgi:hypothetical protein